MYVKAVTEVIDAKLRYPNTALVSLQYDAETFGGSVAKLAVDLKGVKLRYRQITTLKPANTLGFGMALLNAHIQTTLHGFTMIFAHLSATELVSELQMECLINGLYTV